MSDRTQIIILRWALAFAVFLAVLAIRGDDNHDDRHRAVVAQYKAEREAINDAIVTFAKIHSAAPCPTCIAITNEERYRDALKKRAEGIK